MDFKMRIDKEAQTSLPDIDLRNSGVQLSDAELYIHLGQKFQSRIQLAHVERARPVPDPRPEVYLPLGVSAAVEKLGSDTLCVLGSHDGLVALDFNQPVETRTRPIDPAPELERSPEDETVQVRHLILSMDDSDGFIAAINERAGVESGA